MFSTPSLPPPALVQQAAVAALGQAQLEAGVVRLTIDAHAFIQAAAQQAMGGQRIADLAVALRVAGPHLSSADPLGRGDAQAAPRCSCSARHSGPVHRPPVAVPGPCAGATCGAGAQASSGSVSSETRAVLFMVQIGSGQRGRDASVGPCRAAAHDGRARLPRHVGSASRAGSERDEGVHRRGRRDRRIHRQPAGRCGVRPRSVRWRVGATLQALRQHGWRLRLGDALIQAPATASAQATELGVQDLVVIAVKGPALPALAPTLAPLLGAQTLILPAMNGVALVVRPGGAGPGRCTAAKRGPGRRHRRGAAAGPGDRLRGACQHRMPRAGPGRAPARTLA